MSCATEGFSAMTRVFCIRILAMSRLVGAFLQIGAMHTRARMISRPKSEEDPAIPPPPEPAAQGRRSGVHGTARRCSTVQDIARARRCRIRRRASSPGTRRSAATRNDPAKPKPHLLLPSDDKHVIDAKLRRQRRAGSTTAFATRIAGLTRRTGASFITALRTSPPARS